MTTDIQTTEARDMGRVAESLVTRGDLSDLTPAERARHYIRTCEGLGLNPASQPFSFLTLQGKLVMYANRGASDQLAAMHRVTRRIIRGPEEFTLGGQKLVIAVCEASMPNGRIETAIATVPMTDPVNVLMKAETKAKRRATLSILGLGMLDETELETIPAGAKGSATQVDVSIVRRDDAPAQLAAPDALAAFRADLDAAESLDLDGARRIYGAHDLGGTSLPAVTAALVGALATRGYRLTAQEAGQLLRGEMPEALALAYDRLAAVDRHADDEDGDAVVASVVMVLRGAGSLPKPAKSRLLKVAAQTIAALLEVDADVAASRLDAALRPQPPTTPTGTDAPRSTSASAEGGSVAPSASAGAQASASPRLVLDADEAEARYLRSDAIGAEAWAAHLAACVGVFAMAGAHAKRVESFRAAGVLAARRGATLAAIEAREGRGPEAALQALDGYRTRRVVPIGASVRARSHREQVAARTGTDG